MQLTNSVVTYKLRAASASLAIFLVFAALLTFVTSRLWYPDYLFWTDGGWQGLRLVCAVDFVLGPLLALVFFHPEKSRGKLLFDIVVIAAIQLFAMGWGAWQVYGQRPLVVVYGDHRFISVAPAILAMQHKTAADMQAYSTDRPPYAYRREPVTAAERDKKFALLMRYGIHFEAQAWLFEPVLPNLDRIFDRQAAIREYIGKNVPDRWRDWVAVRAQKDMADYRFAVYEGRYENAMLIFAAPAQYLGYLPLGPGLAPDIVDPVPASVDKAH